MKAAAHLASLYTQLASLYTHLASLYTQLASLYTQLASPRAPLQGIYCKEIRRVLARPRPLSVLHLACISSGDAQARPGAGESATCCTRSQRLAIQRPSELKEHKDYLQRERAPHTTSPPATRKECGSRLNYRFARIASPLVPLSPISWGCLSADFYLS
jgi:hypothetical protein